MIIVLLTSGVLFQVWVLVMLLVFVCPTQGQCNMGALLGSIAMGRELENKWKLDFNFFLNGKCTCLPFCSSGKELLEALRVGDGSWVMQLRIILDFP